MTQVFDAPLFTSDHGMDRLLSAGLPVLLIFTSGGAAADLRKELERIARERAGKLLVALADLRDAGAAARRFGVAGMPAVVDVRGGKSVGSAEQVGAGELEAHARYLLGEGPKPVRHTEAAAGAAAAAAGAGKASGGAAQPIPVTDDSFERVVMQSDRPVVVDFWAPWCGPCRITNPMVERLAREHAGRIVVAKVNVDENPKISERYGIQSIPTMMVVRGGTVVDRWAGALPEAALKNRLAPVLS